MQSKKPVLVVGDWLTKNNRYEARKDNPFAGYEGRLLRAILHSAGLDPKKDCAFTKVFMADPGNAGLKYFCIPKARVKTAGDIPIKEEWLPHIDRLHQYVEYINPNIILALGEVPMWALTEKRGLEKYRGTILISDRHNKKVLPTYPISSIIAQWSLRVILQADFEKACKEATSPTYERKPRYILIEPTIQEIRRFMEDH
ncbi:hypothetical protein D6827_01690, partial [Candidatus Parcubacteria bacterium]